MGKYMERMWQRLSPYLDVLFNDRLRAAQKCEVTRMIPICEPWCWYIYLQNWVIFGENVGKYSIHGAYGSVPFSSWTFRPHMICFLWQSTLKVWNHSSLSLGMGQNHHTLPFLKMLQKGYCMFSEYLVLGWFESTLLARLDTPSSFLWIPSFFEQFRRTIHEKPSQIGLVMACLKIAYPQRWCVDGCWAWPNALDVS
jgi:hypothetical protein